MTPAMKWAIGLGPKPELVTLVPSPVVFEKVYPVHSYGGEVTPYTDAELIEMVNYWVDHYTRNGDMHYADTKYERIVEIYWDRIIERVANELVGTDSQVDAICERINNIY